MWEGGLQFRLNERGRRHRGALERRCACCFEHSEGVNEGVQLTGDLAAGH